MDGLLLLDKPPAWTSHDVVDAVRRKFGQRSVGHAGTLDPMATGLLILLLGKATKRSAQLSGLDKSYRGSIRLGVVTDSWDRDGKVLESRPVPPLTVQEIRRTLNGLLGEQLLAPPSFSAVKRQGRKAYEMARRGTPLLMEPRRMVLRRIELESFETPEIRFDLDCSKGTYVRSIAHEVGSRLGCGGTLSELVRSRIGNFRLEEALDLPTFLGTPAEELERRLR